MASSISIDRAPSLHRPRYRYALLATVLAVHVLVLLVLLRFGHRSSKEPSPTLVAVTLIGKDESSQATDNDSVPPAATPEQTAPATHVHKPSRSVVAKPSQDTTHDPVSAAPALPSASSALPTNVAERAPPPPMAREAERPLPQPTPPSADADYLSNPAPAYPRASRELREEGLVTLRVHVTAAGAPDDVQLQRSSGYPRLDQAAVDVVWRWRFVPARQGDEDVAGSVLIPIRFTLKS